MSKSIVDYWPNVVAVNRNNFVYKSLSCWAVNIAVGCLHACRFCYVPGASTIKLAKPLKALGVENPDSQWGDYAMLRTWDANAFRQSVKKAMSIPADKLNADGNRAVMLCTTTDPYQTSRDPHWNDARREIVQKALGILLHESDLNVRILTRSPLAQEDFALYKAFGNRLLFGMSLPTLDNQLARIYEPHAPAPSQRLETLRRAKAIDLNVFVAMAPTYPECDANDLRKTLEAIKSLDPVTVFHEPINIRAENVARISEHAKSLGRTLQTEVFANPTAWRNYALQQLIQVEELGAYLKLPIHLWPDKAMGSKDAIAEAEFGGWRTNHLEWLQGHWNKISAWPK